MPTETNEPKPFPLTLRLRSDIMPKVNAAAHLLGLSRTAFIRMAIYRSLDHFQAVELPRILAHLGKR